MTQERLAEMLSISPQAVSRWETGAAMPDLSLIAPLCNIFGITSDELLEIDIRNRQEKIREYADEYGRFASALQKTEDLRQQTICKLREGLRLYPDAKLLKQQLVTVLWLNIEKPADLAEKREMCRLAKELIDATSDIKEKSRYIFLYCTYARFTGNSEEGKTLTELLPETECSRQRLYALCCEDDDERREQFYRCIISAWGELRSSMLGLITDCRLSPEDIIDIRSKQEKIHTLLFDGDDSVQYEDFDEYKVAKALYNAGDRDLCIQYLAVCLSKWTEEHEVVYRSSMRDHLPDRNISKEYTREEKDLERKANAEDYIASIHAYFPELLSDKRMMDLISKAKQFT
jgi:transcriptional regulator with XRE-family HTH domain